MSCVCLRLASTQSDAHRSRLGNVHQRMQSAAVSSAAVWLPGAKQEWTRSWSRRSAIPFPEQGLFNSRNLAAPVAEQLPERPPAGEGPAEMFRFSSIGRVLSRPRGRR